jgi:hypothetical protein
MTWVGKQLPAWPVVYVLEVDRRGPRLHALVTGSAAGVLWATQPLERRVTYRRCRAHEVVRQSAGGHGPPGSHSNRQLSSCSSTPRSEIER